MSRRLVRLEPPYIVSIALALALWHLSALAPGFRGDHPDYTPGQLAAHLLYLIPVTEFDWLQPVYWSLAWEFVFYITMGLGFSLVSPAKSSMVWYCITALMLALVAMQYVPARLLLFVIGIALFRITTGASKQIRFGDLILAILSVSVIAIVDLRIASVGICTALVIYFFRGTRAPPVIAMPLAFLGAISYSLYLTHVPIGGRLVSLGKRFGETPAFEFAISSLSLLVCLVFAVAFWLFVERPFINLSKAVTKPRP